MPNAGDKQKPPAPKQMDSRQLLGRDREIYILHNNERYVLRITANNKLILTK
jgi:hemin uptake protein HemP